MTARIETKRKSYIRDVILSKAHLLAQNLVFEPNTVHGGFVISFIIMSPTGVLKKISENASEMRDKNVELWFFRQDTKNSLAERIPDSKLYDYFNASYIVEIKRSHSPYIEHADDEPIYHIDIIFIPA